MQEIFFFMSTFRPFTATGLDIFKDRRRRPTTTPALPLLLLVVAAEDGAVLFPTLFGLLCMYNVYVIMLDI